MARGSWARRADPRFKWLGTLALVLVFVSLDRPEALVAGIVVTLLGALVCAGISLRDLGSRLLATLPFVLVAGLAVALSGTGGPVRAAALALRVLGAVLAMTALTLSTERAALFSGAARLGFPAVILTLAELALRYLAVLSDEARRLARARRARGFEPAVIWKPEVAAAFGSLVGALLLRSLDRAERVHLARLARGGETGLGGVGAPARRATHGSGADAELAVAPTPGGDAPGPDAPGPGAEVRPSLAWLALTLLPAVLMVVVERRGL